MMVSGAGPSDEKVELLSDDRLIQMAEDFGKDQDGAIWIRALVIGLLQRWLGTRLRVASLASCAWAQALTVHEDRAKGVQYPGECLTPALPRFPVHHWNYDVLGRAFICTRCQQPVIPMKTVRHAQRLAMVSGLSSMSQEEKSRRRRG